LEALRRRFFVKFLIRSGWSGDVENASGGFVCGLEDFWRSGGENTLVESRLMSVVVQFLKSLGVLPNGGCLENFGGLEDWRVAGVGAC
jgi:hypothetical protein